MLLLIATAPARAAPPLLPLADASRLLSGLTLPPADAGGSSALSWAVGDPVGAPLENVTLRFEFYAFNAYPGNATAPLPGDGPQFAGAGVSSTESLGVVGLAGANGSLTVTVPDGAPAGTYAVRTQLTFTANGTGYRLASRGFFTEAQWGAATSTNGSSTLNVSRLNVSGVVPETALLVRPPAPTALWALLGVALVLAAAGGYYAWRAAGKSSSGASAPPPPSRAPKALGKRRKRAGD